MFSAATITLRLLLLAIPGPHPGAIPGAVDLQAAGTTSASPQQIPTPPPAVELPSDLGKIKEAVAAPSSLNLVDKNPFRFYVTTVAPSPKFSEMLGDFDVFNGPVPYSGMTHRDFLELTRPTNLKAGGSFPPGDLLKWTLLTYVQRKGFELLADAYKELKEAKTEAERKQIRARIEKELAALRGETIK
jgi:hypothetical protein